MSSRPSCSPVPAAISEGNMTHPRASLAACEHLTKSLRITWNPTVDALALQPTACEVTGPWHCCLLDRIAVTLHIQHERRSWHRP